MGHTESKERSLFVDITKHMLKKRSINVTSRQLREFFSFVQNVSPWFPEEGTVNLDTWQKVGKQMKEYYTKNGPDGVPIDAFALWNVLKDSFDPTHEAICMAREVATEEEQPLVTAMAKTGSYTSIERPPAYNIQKDHSSSSESESEAESEREDKLNPFEVDELERVAAQYEHNNVSSFFSFMGAVKEAKAQGNTELKCYPVIWGDDNSPPQWEPLPFKLIKELKMAVKDLGPTSPYTLQLLDNVASEWLSPFDWFSTARSCLAPGSFLLWKADYEEKAKGLVQKNLLKRPQNRITLSMLIGEGPYADPKTQLELTRETLQEVSRIAVLAWRQLPAGDLKSSFLSTIKQAAQEPYEDFVARLELNVEKLTGSQEAKDIVLKQLAFENANSTCQALLRPIRKSGSLTDYIKMCADASPAYVQGLAMAAALQGLPYQQLLKNMQQNSQNPHRGKGCFKCGEFGHLSRECPVRNTQGSLPLPGGMPPQISPQNLRPTSLCSRCAKGFHWTKDCRSKYHKDGTPLAPGPMSTPFQKGPIVPHEQKNEFLGCPPAPNQNRGKEAMKSTAFPSMTWSEQLLEALD
ncbi:endogenous retrovirus group K member 5 Gag polyprotein-like [Tamandua tetradactyla]|uniref:endogenous retrovirus group K member 5 Gag polyprotein-like n=1 Tax=Tamandua tetradactyla TaxID=48850 RepID=UPI0040540BB5